MLFKLNSIKSALGYSSNLTVFNLINYFSRSADEMIIGKTMSPFTLGSYSLAYRIMLFPIQSLTFIFARAFFPCDEQGKNDNSYLKETYINVVVFIYFIVCPLMCGLIVLREPFILLVFGDEWLLTASILMWLAPVAVIQSIISPSGAVLLAKGKPHILILLGTFALILDISAFLIGSRFNIITFTKLYFIAHLINFFPVMSVILRLIEGTFTELLKRLIRPSLCSLVMYYILSGCVDKRADYISPYNILGTLLYILLGIAIYTIMCVFCPVEFQNYKNAIQITY